MVWHESLAGLHAVFSAHNKPAHLNHFPDAVNTIGQQALHAPVIIHVISMPDAHEQDVRGESWDSVRHGLGIHISDEILDDLVFIFAWEFDHAADLVLS